MPTISRPTLSVFVSGRRQPISSAIAQEFRARLAASLGVQPETICNLGEWPVAALQAVE